MQALLTLTSCNTLSPPCLYTQGPIPAEIGLLSDLRILRLSYNSFIGNVPTELANLDNLELFQIHSNRIAGTVPHITLKEATAESDFDIVSSFIADCGNPSDFEESLECTECTMCCKSNSLLYSLQDVFAKVISSHSFH